MPYHKVLVYQPHGKPKCRGCRFMAELFQNVLYQKAQVTWWSKVPSLFVCPRFCIHFGYPNLQLIYTSYSRDISLFISLLIEDVEFTRTIATKLINAKNVFFV